MKKLYFGAFVAAMAFASAALAGDTYAVNSETACSQVPLSEAEYCINLDSTWNGRSMYTHIENSDTFATLKLDSSDPDIVFNTVDTGDDSVTGYYFGTNNTTPESELSLKITFAASGFLMYTVYGARNAVVPAIVDSDGYLLAAYSCRMVEGNPSSPLMNDTNYLACSPPVPAAGETAIPKRGAILRLYLPGQLPEEGPYVEPEPEPEPGPANDEAGAAEEVENVETGDSLLMSLMLGVGVLGIVATMIARLASRRTQR